MADEETFRHIVLARLIGANCCYHYLNQWGTCANHLGQNCSREESLIGVSIVSWVNVCTFETRCKIVAKTKKGDPGGSPFLLYNQVVNWLRR